MLSVGRSLRQLSNKHISRMRIGVNKLGKNIIYAIFKDLPCKTFSKYVACFSNVDASFYHLVFMVDIDAFHKLHRYNFGLHHLALTLQYFKYTSGTFILTSSLNMLLALIQLRASIVKSSSCGILYFMSNTRKS